MDRHGVMRGATRRMMVTSSRTSAAGTATVGADERAGCRNHRPLRVGEQTERAIRQR